MFSEFGESLIVKNFREFYTELLTVKRIIAHDGAGTHVHKINPIHLKSTLESIIRKQEGIAAKIGGYFLEPYSDARFAMIAFADEILINSNWEHSKFWQSELLEMSLNGSYIAGEEFFRRADSILTERRTQEYIESAKVYLLCLWLGFKGKYRFEGGEDFINKYISQLYEYVYDKPISYEDGIKLTEDKELHIQRKNEIQYFPPAYRRYLMLLSVLLLFVLLTTVYWYYLTNPIRAALNGFFDDPIKQEVTQVKKQKTLYQPQLDVSITDENNLPIAGLCTIEDSTGFTQLQRLEINQNGKASLKLQKNVTTRIVLEAKGKYPVVFYHTALENNRTAQSIVLRSLSSFRDSSVRLGFITFSPGSSELQEISNSFLSRLASAIQSTPDLSEVVISGYSDNTGSKAANKRLSKERAESVLNFLVRMGVDSEKLVSQGYGMEYPIADNSTTEGKLLNRRVEVQFKLLKDK